MSNTSGLAGIAHWINTYFRLKGDQALEKTSPLVIEIKEWVDQEYADGRVTVMTDEELLKEITSVEKKLGISLAKMAEEETEKDRK